MSGCRTHLTRRTGRRSTAVAARDAVAALRDVLIAAGLDREFPYLRADLNAFGMGVIELGRISPETAQRLAELLRLALGTGREHDHDGRNESDD